MNKCYSLCLKVSTSRPGKRNKPLPLFSFAVNSTAIIPTKAHKSALDFPDIFSDSTRAGPGVLYGKFLEKLW